MNRLTGIAFILLFCTQVCAQNDSPNTPVLQGRLVIKDRFPVVMPAGKQYKASGWKTIWWGKHYRKEWTTPVMFPILDISTYEGGLAPLKAGGGHQSKTLRLISGNGKEYVLRTIDKSLDVLVPDDLKGTFINDLVNDQISTAHPYGPVAIASMAGSLSLMHTNPVIYYVPDDPLLQEFRPVFANKLCLLEERPSGKGWEHSALFGDADKIINTEDLLEEVYKSSKNSVDQGAFLEVRVFDMIVNDWDRHEDQWIWAKEKASKHNTYTPIARDRDQAFSKTDGISLYFLSRRYAFRPLQSMNTHVRDIRGANFSARNLDQQFLNELTKEEWKQRIRFVQDHLTDSSIAKGIHTMPVEVNKVSGDFLIHRLAERRDNMMKDGMRYYSMLSKKISINGSADNERFIIGQEKDNEVAVTAIRLDNDTFYHRVFTRNETKEINIYGLDGDDQFIINGNARNKFTIRMIGGEGKDQYTAAASASQGKRYRAYDSVFQEKLSRKSFRTNRIWDTVYQYKRASVKYDWYIPLIIPGYNPDDQFTISLGLLYKKQQWGKTPFGWQQSLAVDYATGTSAIGFAYKGLFKQTFGKWDLDIATFYKGPRYTFNYYGFGNETALNGNEKSYFRVKANDFFFSPGVSRSWKYSSLRFGLQYENVEVLRSQDKFVTSPGSKLPTSVFSAINFAGVNGQWTVSNVDNQRYQTKGVQFTAGFSFLNNLDNTDRRMLKLNSSVAVYQNIFNWLTFAHRTGATTIAGDYEFYQAAMLGGNENLRGYWRNRFAGKSDFYQNTELRISLGNLRGYVVRGKIGLFGFFDDGRVWVKDENSSKIHTGYGGGIFLLPYNMASFTLYYASSKETNLITLRAGFFF